MLTVFVSLLPVFILIAVGFALRKSGIIPEEHWRGVELISFWILIPALLITVMSDSSVGVGQEAALALTTFLTILSVCVLVWLLRRPLNRWLGMEGPAYTSLFQTSTRWHGFIALAIASKLFGADGLALMAIPFAVMAPFLNVVNILVLAIYASKEPSPKRLIVRSIIRNPLIWAIAIGLAIRFSGLTMPDVAATTLKLAGDAALGVTLLALGAGLSWRAVKRSGKEVVLGTFLKLILTPLIAIGFAMTFGITGMGLVIIVLTMGVPTAVNGYVLARTMGGDPELYAATMTAQVIVSFLTLPVLLWWAMQFTA